MRAGIAVELSDGTRTGQGEATPPEELGFDTVQLAQAALEAVIPELERTTPPHSAHEVRAILATMAALQTSAAARHAVELALLDVVAQGHGIPLARVLAEAPRRRVVINALLGRGDGPDAAARAVERGFGTLKLKVGGRPVAEDVERVQSVRERVGREVKLRIDANGSWSESEAVAALQALARLELELCEQPTADTDAMLRVRQQARVPIAADESLGLPSWRPALVAGNVDVLVLKPMVLGGVLFALDLAVEAAHYDVGAYVTSSIDGEIARAGAAHLAAAIPQSRWAHGVATGSLLAVPSRTDWLSPAGGELELPRVPGLGMAG